MKELSPLRPCYKLEDITHVLMKYTLGKSDALLDKVLSSHHESRRTEGKAFRLHTEGEGSAAVHHFRILVGYGLYGCIFLKYLILGKVLRLESDDIQISLAALSAKCFESFGNYPVIRIQHVYVFTMRPVQCIVSSG